MLVKDSALHSVDFSRRVFIRGGWISSLCLNDTESNLAWFTGPPEALVLPMITPESVSSTCLLIMNLSAHWLGGNRRLPTRHSWKRWQHLVWRWKRDKVRLLSSNGQLSPSSPWGLVAIWEKLWIILTIYQWVYWWKNLGIWLVFTSLHSSLYRTEWAGRDM